jgi:adenylate cyclase
MAKEIERKFMVDLLKWKPGTQVTSIVQGYLLALPHKVIRVRIANNDAFLTIKGSMQGITRDEFEYAIPLPDAKQLLTLCEYNLVEKLRYIEYVEGKKWEIDVFKGKNMGLVIAEIELDSEEETIEKPHWILDEVSVEEKYFNFNLAKYPFLEWS